MNTNYRNVETVSYKILSLPIFVSYYYYLLVIIASRRIWFLSFYLSAVLIKSTTYIHKRHLSYLDADKVQQSIILWRAYKIRTRTVLFNINQYWAHKCRYKVHKLYIYIYIYIYIQTSRCKRICGSPFAAASVRASDARRIADCRISPLNVAQVRKPAYFISI
jgi:hypothetical protein